jgi:hypothetical protein
MTPAGWTIMLLSVSSVVAVCAYCVFKVLSLPPRGSGGAPQVSARHRHSGYARRRLKAVRAGRQSEQSSRRLPRRNRARSQPANGRGRNQSDLCNRSCTRRRFSALATAKGTRRSTDVRCAPSHRAHHCPSDVVSESALAPKRSSAEDPRSARSSG